MKHIMKELGQKPIAVYSIYVDLTGSLSAGVLLSQITYWAEKMGWEEFYKSDAELMQETRLTQSEFKTAKKIITQSPFLSIERKGAPFRTYYQVNFEELETVLHQFSSSFTYQLGSRTTTNQRGVNLRASSSLTYRLDGSLPTSQTVVNLPTLIGTKNTTEITAENTTIVETSSTPFLDENEVEDIEQQIFASKATKERKKKVAPKKKESDTTPIRPMFEVYAEKYAELNNGQKPEFMVKYTGAMKKLFQILEQRSIEKKIVHLDKLQPWRDFLDMWGGYLVKNPKERWYRENFNPNTFFSQFNSILPKLAAPGQTTRDKWEEFAKRNNVAFN